VVVDEVEELDLSAVIKLQLKLSAQPKSCGWEGILTKGLPSVGCGRYSLLFAGALNSPFVVAIVRCDNSVSNHNKI
jgi:hypothetical protein